MQVTAARWRHPRSVRCAAWMVDYKKTELIWGALHELKAAGLVTLADKGGQALRNF